MAFTSNLSATTWYVATTGSDGNPGTQSAPFATIQQGVNKAQPGDTVSVADGSYGPNGHYTCGIVCSSNSYAAPVSISKSGTSSAPITITGQSKWGAVLNCDLPYGYSGDGTDGVQACDAYFSFVGSASYITIQNFAVTGGFWAGADVNGSNSHISFVSNHFYNIGNRHYAITSGMPDYGIVGVFAGTGTSYITWDGNEFNNIGRLPTSGQSVTDYDHDHGVYGYNGPYTFTNNIFHDQDSGWNIQMAPGTHDIQILNNTFVSGNNPGRNGCLMLWGQTTNITLENNIFASCLTYAAETYQAVEAGAIFTNNILYNTPNGLIDSYSGSISQSGNLLNTNPLFVNAAGYDYHLQAGSPAIDAGASDGVGYDFDGNLRPYGPRIDIGAYEYGSSPAIAGTPNASSTPAGGTAIGGFTISAASLSFSVATGSTSSTQYVTLANKTTSSITYTNATLSTSVFQYAGVGTCNVGMVIAPGGSCTISVKFVPTAKGAATGTLTITDNVAKAAHLVSLSGTGQ